MELDNKTNYIVSGIERSGTSMLMQIINAGGIPISFDKSRKPDDNNPKGYFELEGGKIINKLMESIFPLDLYKGEFIKITAYGLKYLPEGKYKIIYSERNIDEILDSMEKMTGEKDKDRSKNKDSFQKLNKMIKQKIISREDIEVLFLNYNEIIKEQEKNIKKIISFLKMNDLDVEEMMSVIDPGLYRHRRAD
ncbi:MAG: sulfotransferase domain-containing protein [Thermoplasmatales archaeon]|nr:sulfotransferase domain-containing protein [Thermoplasmatales archaeon]